MFEEIELLVHCDPRHGIKKAAKKKIPMGSIIGIDLFCWYVFSSVNCLHTIIIMFYLLISKRMQTCSIYKLINQINAYICEEPQFEYNTLKFLMYSTIRNNYRNY